MIVAVTLGACAAQYHGVDGSGGQPAALVLKQGVVVPVGQSRVFVQEGEVISRRELDRYRPHCNLEIEALAGEEEVIREGRFEVVRIQRLREEVVNRRANVYASLRMTGLDDDDGQTTIILGLHFWLQSEDQPKVRRLTCHGSEDDPQRAELPTYDEIAAALGGVAELVW